MMDMSEFFPLWISRISGECDQTPEERPSVLRSCFEVVLTKCENPAIREYLKAALVEFSSVLPRAFVEECGSTIDKMATNEKKRKFEADEDVEMTQPQQ